MGSCTRNGIRIAVTSGIVAGALALSACSGSASEELSPEDAEGVEGSSIEEAAKEEGSVVWYTSVPEAAVTEVAEGFTAVYGIDVEIVRFPSTTLMQRYAAERDAGTVLGDVINVAETAFFDDGVESGWWADFSDDEMPSLAEWPSELVHEEQYSLLNTQPIALAYNTTAVEESDVDSWEKLADPALDGEVVLVNPENTPYYMSWVKLLKDEFGPDLLEAIKGHGPTIVDSAVPGAQQLAAGEDFVMVPAVVSGVVEVMEAGAPVETVFPEPTVGVEQYVAASADGPNPNAAKLFVNYLLSPHGQEQVSRGYAASPLPDIPDALPLPDDYRETDVDAVLAERAELVDLLVP